MTDPATLVEPMKGMDTVAITVGYEGKNSTLMKAVEFTGVECSGVLHGRTLSPAGGGL